MRREVNKNGIQRGARDPTKLRARAEIRLTSRFHRAQKGSRKSQKRKSKVKRNPERRTSRSFRLSPRLLRLNEAIERHCKLDDTYPSTVRSWSRANSKTGRVD